MGGYSRGSFLTADAAVPDAVRFPVNGEVLEEEVVLDITGGRVAYGVCVWVAPDAEADTGAAAAPEGGGRDDGTEADTLGLLGAGRILVGCCCCWFLKMGS